MGGKPSRFLARGFFVQFGIAVVEDLDFDPGVGKSVGGEILQSALGGPKKESRVAAMGQVSPPSDEFKVAIFFGGTKNPDRLTGAMHKRPFPCPGGLVAIGPNKIRGSEFDPAISLRVDLNHGRGNANRRVVLADRTIAGVDQQEKGQKERNCVLGKPGLRHDCALLRERHESEGKGLATRHDTMAALFGHDDVVENSDSEQIAHFGEPISDRVILAAGSRVPGWMIVYEQDR